MKSDYLIASDIRKNRSTLMHHGIDGQKWGVKHGPPYPLGSGVSTGSRLRKGARAKHIVKSATAGAAIGAIAGGVVGGPVGAGLSAAASAAASAAKAAWKTRKKTENSGVNVKKSKHDVHEGNISYKNGNKAPTKEDKALAKNIASEGYGKWILNEAAEANDNNWPAFEKYTNSDSAFVDTKNKNSSIIFKSEKSAVKNDKKSGAVDGKVYTVDSVEIPISNDGNYDPNRSCKFTREYYDASDGEFLVTKKVNISSSKKASGSNKSSSAKPKISDTKIKNAIINKIKDVKDKNGNSYIDSDNLKRLGYDPKTKQDTWTDGNGNYFTLELSTDPNTGNDTINPKLISWDD